MYYHLPGKWWREDINSRNDVLDGQLHTDQSLRQLVGVVRGNLKSVFISFLILVLACRPCKLCHWKWGYIDVGSDRIWCRQGLKTKRFLATLTHFNYRAKRKGIEVQERENLWIFQNLFNFFFQKLAKTRPSEIKVSP